MRRQQSPARPWARTGSADDRPQLGACGWPVFAISRSSSPSSESRPPSRASSLRRCKFCRISTPARTSTPIQANSSTSTGGAPGSRSQRLLRGGGAHGGRIGTASGSRSAIQRQTVDGDLQLPDQSSERRSLAIRPAGRRQHHPARRGGRLCGAAACHGGVPPGPSRAERHGGSRPLDGRSRQGGPREAGGRRLRGDRAAAGASKTWPRRTPG